ncbi:MAG: dienelactone hydrolase family protein [Anaerolineales bacterium]|nr:dienelactone hydrolase family protein [Anaerolineales bacterium]
MSKVEFLSEGSPRTGYLAIPQTSNGGAILVLHAWWGLTPLFTSLCDQLAAEGYVAFAPDLHLGKTADTIPDAQALVENGDFPTIKATALAALDFFQHHPAAEGKPLGVLGFSFGAAYSLLLNHLQPSAFSAITLFYGGSDMGLPEVETPLLCHFAEIDDYEPLEVVQNLTLRNGARHIYPGTHHWFFESNRPEYNKEATTLAWQRTLAFFKEKLIQPR